MRSCRDFFWPVQAMNLIRTIFWLTLFHFALIIKSSLNKKFVMPVSCESSSVKIWYLLLFSTYKNLGILLLWKLSLFFSLLLCSELHFYIVHFHSVQSQLVFILSDVGASHIFLVLQKTNTLHESFRSSLQRKHNTLLWIISVLVFVLPK